MKHKEQLKAAGLSEHMISKMMMSAGAYDHQATTQLPKQPIDTSIARDTEAELEADAETEEYQEETLPVPAVKASKLMTSEAENTDKSRFINAASEPLSSVEGHKGGSEERQEHHTTHRKGKQTQARAYLEHGTSGERQGLKLKDAMEFQEKKHAERVTRKKGKGLIASLLRRVFNY